MTKDEEAAVRNHVAMMSEDNPNRRHFEVLLKHLGTYRSRRRQPHAKQGDCVEFVLEDGRRFAWSESNIQYEEISEDAGSFTMLRKRLDGVNAEQKQWVEAVPHYVRAWAHRIMKYEDGYSENAPVINMLLKLADLREKWPE